MAVYALRFGGFALTADTWLAQKDLLEKYIVGRVKLPNQTILQISVSKHELGSYLQPLGNAHYN
jgi:hypothetical protein